jgi:hypothetical protein
MSASISEGELVLNLEEDDDDQVDLIETIAATVTTRQLDTERSVHSSSDAESTSSKQSSSFNLSDNDMDSDIEDDDAFLDNLARLQKTSGLDDEPVHASVLRTQNEIIVSELQRFINV